MCCGGVGGGVTNNENIFFTSFVGRAVAKW